MLSLTEMREYKREFWGEPIAGEPGRVRLVFNEAETVAIERHSKERNVPLIAESTFEERAYGSTVLGISGTYAAMAWRLDNLLELRMRESYFIDVKIILENRIISGTRLVYEEKPSK